jgi:hypothetical protein
MVIVMVMVMVKVKVMAVLDDLTAMIVLATVVGEEGDQFRRLHCT